MEEEYKYRNFIQQPYNITTRLIDEKVEGGLGDKIAVYYRDNTYTYREMQNLINKTGNALKNIGVRIGDRVMLVMKDSPEAMASFFGVIKLGAIPIPVNYMYTKHDYRYLLNDSRARTLIADEEYLTEIEGFKDKFLYLENTIIVGNNIGNQNISFYEIVKHASDKLDAAYTTFEDEAFWNYTSGSSGTPKAAVHLQHDAMVIIENYARGILGITGNDIILSASKFFFSYGLGNSFIFPLGTGASVILLPDRPKPEIMFEVIDRYKPTVFFGVPTLYANMIQIKDAEKKYDISSVRIFISAGEALPKEIFHEWKRKFGPEILDGIGSSEVGHIFISNHPGDAKPGSSGKIVPGYQVRIVDGYGNEIPDGETGDLRVKGESTAAFYYRNHEKTKTSMIGEWFNTGDKYYKDSEGYYYYCGRSDDMLKVGGIWVSPIELEDTLICHPAVLEAAVVAKSDEQELIKPKAYVVLKEGYEPSKELTAEIQAFIKKSLAPYKYPRWIEFIKELPRTSTGKIQRYKLRG